MAMKFISDPIDFVATNRMILEEFKASQYALACREYRPNKLVFRRNFGWPIVAMTSGVTSHGFDAKTYKGLKRCLQYQISKLKIREYLLGIIPMPSHRRPFGPPSLEKEQNSLLADSLILTSVKYHLGGPVNLDGPQYARKTFLDAVQGFQWSFHWTAEGKSLRHTENDLISVFEKGELEFLLETIESRAFYEGLDGW